MRADTVICQSDRCIKSNMAWDHFHGDIDDPCGVIADFCGVIADFCGVIADPCGVVAIPEVIGGRRCGDSDRCATR